MSTPEHHPLDPVREQLGELRGRSDALDTSLDARFRAVDACLTTIEARLEQLPSKGSCAGSFPSSSRSWSRSARLAEAGR